MVRANAKWVVAPDEHRVWLWLDEPPSLFEWDRIEVTLHRYLTESKIETFVLAGLGWSAPHTSRMAAALHRDLRKRGIAVDLDTQTVPYLSLGHV